jgi:hypothetical protein
LGPHGVDPPGDLAILLRQHRQHCGLLRQKAARHVFVPARTAHDEAIGVGPNLESNGPGFGEHVGDYPLHSTRSSR